MELNRFIKNKMVNTTLLIKIVIPIILLIMLYFLFKSERKSEEKRIKRIVKKSFDDMGFRHKLLNHNKQI